LPDNKPRCTLDFGLKVNTTQKYFSGSPGDVGNISDADNGTRRKDGVRFLIYRMCVNELIRQFKGKSKCGIFGD